MASGRSTKWQRFQFKTFPFSLRFKKGPYCENYHKRKDRYCTCCIGQHFGGFHGGVWDFKNSKEISFEEYKNQDEQ
jgi:hypothetical protein